jgi:predicted enzyme related to lactoylglutathione lyase
VITRLSHTCLIVKDQDEALKWYTEKLGLEVRADITMHGFRWLTVGAKDQKNLEIVLGLPRDEDQTSQVGKQSLGVFASNDCRKDVETFRERGVEITGGAEEMPWGIQAMFHDLYGNQFVMIQPAHP